MTTDHHTPYIDGTTTYKADDMNAPLAELDSALGDFSGKRGQIPRVNSGESAFEYMDSAYDIGGSFGGSPEADVVLMRFPFVRSVTIPAGAGLSRFIAGTAATASTEFSLQKNGVEFGTATFGAGGSVAVFSIASDAEFQYGDVLTIVAPGVADATLADLGWCLAGYRNPVTMSTTTTTTTTTSSTTSTTTSSTTTTTTTSSTTTTTPP